MSYCCCPANPEKKKEWKEEMLPEIDFLDNDIEKPVRYSALSGIR